MQLHNFLYRWRAEDGGRRKRTSGELKDGGNQKLSGMATVAGKGKIRKNINIKQYFEVEIAHWGWKKYGKCKNPEYKVVMGGKWEV